MTYFVSGNAACIIDRVQASNAHMLFIVVLTLSIVGILSSFGYTVIQ